MKNKPFKRVLSVFMATLMLMSAWVFVEPMHSHAESASSISSKNLSEINALPSAVPTVTTVRGAFEADNDNLTDDNYNAVYHNVLYTDVTVSKEGGGQAVSDKTQYGSNGTGSNGVTVHWYHPQATLMYDGGTDLPRMGVALNTIMYFTGIWSRRTINRSSWLQSGIDGFAFTQNWHGSDSRLNFQWMWNSCGDVMSYTYRGTDPYSDLSGNSDDHFYANILRFTGSMGDDEYYRVGYPQFGFYGDNTSSNREIYATSKKTIGIINFVPLKKAMEKALEIKAEIQTAPAKYTNASVSEFVNLANALFAANPNNYVNASKNDPNGYASAAKTAVDNFNNFGGLKVQQYNVTFVRQNGDIALTLPYDYNSAFDITSAITSYNSFLTNSSTQIAGNNSYHQSYQWDKANAPQTILDDVTIREVTGGTAAHSFGSEAYLNENSHKSVCKDCGYERIVNHTSDGGKITIEPTCTTEGVKTYTCTVCKQAFKTEKVSALGHSFTGDYKEKDTGENGTHYRKCSRCDVYGLNGVVDGCENHTWNAGTMTTAPTCEGTGIKLHTCEKCNATYEETLSANGHKNVTTVEAKKEGCGITGNKKYEKCSDCQKVWLVAEDGTKTEISNADENKDGIPDEAEIQGLTHKFDGALKSQTPGKDGAHYRVCSYCGKAYGLDGEVNKTEPHNWTLDSTVDSTCTKEGTETYKCDCGETKVVTLDKKAHTTTHTEYKAPTCTADGNEEYWYCSECKTYFANEACTETLSKTTIAKLGHEWTAHHEFDSLVSAATCQKAAVYNKHCDRCQAKLTETYSYGEPDKVNGHKFDGEIKDNKDGTHSKKCTVSGCDEYGAPIECDYETVEDVASTCCTQGHTTYKCKDCGYGYSVTKDLDKSNHEKDADGNHYTVVVGKKEANCVDKGYTGDTYCSKCYDANAEDNTSALLQKGEDTAIDSSNHKDEKDVPACDSTCQKDGYKAYKHCDACGKDTTAKETVEKKPHTFTNYVSNGDGTHTATCDTCDEDVATPATDKQNCQGGTATCTQKAVCDTCKAEYGNVDSSNHTGKTRIDKVDSTCQNEGHEAYFYCTACKKPVDEIKTIPVKEHKFTTYVSDGNGKHTATCDTCNKDVATPATDTKNCQGGTAYCNAQAICEVCKTGYGELNASNHASTGTKTVNKVDATCEVDGYTGDVVRNCCYVEGMELTADSPVVVTMGETVKALGHDYSVEVKDSRVDSTCCTEGHVTMKCSRCESTQEQTLELNSKKHEKNAQGEYDTITIGAKEANCEEAGYTGDIYCAKCYSTQEGADNKDALLYKGNVIESSGKHQWGTAVSDGQGRHEDSHWYHIYTCTICGAEKEERCYTYPDHQYNCIETDTCQVCHGQCSLTAPSIHKNGLTKVAEVHATCQSTGVMEYYVCVEKDADGNTIGCGKKFYDAAGTKPVANDSDLITAKAAHSIDWANGEVVKEASCGENGTTRYYCTTEGCGHYIDKDDISSNGVHNWATEYTVVTEATCHSTGYKAICCTICGKAKPGTYLPTAMLEHEYDDGVVTTEATCTTDGVMTYTCTLGCTEEDDGHSYTTPIAAKGHSPKGDWIVETDSTCTKTGVKYKACENCDQHAVEEVIAKKAHTPGEWTIIKQPTCCEAGKKQSQCLVCKTTFTEEIAATGEHSPIYVPGKAPTCEDTGVNEGFVCEDCNTVISGCETLPADENAHFDYDGDGFCDGCKHDLMNGKCDCICHKNFWLIKKVIYPIVRFFWKLFGIGHSCRCGNVHY